MNFKSLLDDIEQLIGLPLKAITATTNGITLLSIDRETGRYIVKPDGVGRERKRNIRELEAIFEALKKDGYCNVEQALQGSFTSRHQPETIFANLPYIQYFKYERRKHLVLRDNNQHSHGEIQELPVREQKKVRKALLSNKKLNQSQLAFELEQTFINLKNEVQALHIKQPGFLVDSQIREILARLGGINEAVQSATISLDSNLETPDNTTTEDAKNSNLDMSDLVDLSSFTGVEDGGENSVTSDNNDDSEGDENDAEPELIVPNIRRQTPSLYALYQRLLHNEIEIQPDYQRQDRIWDDRKKSKLIESILMGLPLPIFYFGERKNDNWVVIDGLQRITTVQDFMMGRFPLKLDKDSPVIEANGKFFTGFDRKFTRLITEFEVTAYVIDMEEDAKNSGNVNRFIIELFHRINTYGVKLSDQEIRSAINFGNSVFFLKFLASSQTFISSTNNTVNPKRQKDLELCLSALSFIIFGYKEFKASKYDDFLSKGMGWINQQDFEKVERKEGQIDYKSESPVIVSLTSKFESSLKFNHELFGKSTFKKVVNAQKKDPISKPLFEVLVTLFANANDEQKEQIRKHHSLFINCLYTAINSDSREYAEWQSPAYLNSDRGLHYALSNSTGKKVTINYRFEAISNILTKTTGCIIEIKPLARLEK